MEHPHNLVTLLGFLKKAFFIRFSLVTTVWEDVLNSSSLYPFFFNVRGRWEKKESWSQAALRVQLYVIKHSSR